MTDLTPLSDAIVAQNAPARSTGPVNSPSPSSASVPPPPPDYYALRKLNREVNARVKGQKFDDCEWYTTFKSIPLKQQGVETERFYVSTDGSEAPNHVILKVGDYYLDNRFENPLTERQMLNAGYRHFPGYNPSGHGKVAK